MLTMRNAFVLIFVLNLALTVWCTNNNKNNNNNNNNNNNKEQTHQEIWDQDVTDTFKIEGTDQGIQRVNLKCGSNSMNVMLETERPFTGVMYTRGSFYKQTAPCFVKSEGPNARSIEMNFQLDQCQTQNENELYSNIVVIQNDPEVITPGDSAFSLECDFRRPRNIQMEANMQTRDRSVVGSTIALRSPDPGNPSKTYKTVHSDTDTVEYTPTHKFSQEEGIIRMGTVEEVTISAIDKDEL